MYSGAKNGEELCSEADHTNGGTEHATLQLCQCVLAPDVLLLRHRECKLLTCLNTRRSCVSCNICIPAGDGSDWKGMCQTGTAQSPIDFPGMNGEQSGRVTV